MFGSKGKVVTVNDLKEFSRKFLGSPLSVPLARSSGICELLVLCSFKQTENNPPFSNIEVLF